MKLRLLLWLLSFVLLLRNVAVFGKRILAIEPYGSKSHWQYMQSILNVLATRHQVTAITPLPTGDRENYTEIDASTVFPIYPETNVIDLIEQFGSVVNMLPLMPERSHERDICDAFYDFEPVKRLFSVTDDGGGYDLILLEPFYSSCLSYVAHRLRVPEIYVIPSAMITPLEMLFFGTEPSPSYVSNLLFKGDVPKSFAERLTNLALFAYVKFVPWLTDVRMAYSDSKAYDVSDVHHRPSLVFTNTHHVTEPPRSFPVNMIQIGGIHLKPSEVLPHVKYNRFSIFFSL